jgi:hypothetical protein
VEHLTKILGRLLIYRAQNNLLPVDKDSGKQVQASENKQRRMPHYYVSGNRIFPLSIFT